ncbi:MAG: TolC family protein [Acidobacteria bacterium]|nr:TolC family protein [Acidobacteriota bacterium]
MRSAWWLMALLLPASGQQQPVAPMKLEDVLASVEKHYPPLLIALQDKVVADADVTAAEGKFDLALKGGYDGDYLGTYRNDVYRAGVEQYSQFQGMQYFAGYTLGQGRFPSYEGKQKTDAAGEYKVGLKMPVLRDRETDSRRADLKKALIGRRIAELGVDQQRLLIVQLATRRYYDWIAAGRRFEIARGVLKTAEARDAQLKEASSLGQIPAIDVTDNQKAIRTRRAQVIEAERALMQASIELSLYYRNERGQPVLPAAEMLPASFPGMQSYEMSRLQDDIDLAIKRRPEIRRFQEQRSQVEVDRKLAQNQLLPGVDVVFSYTRQTGEREVARGPNDLVAALVFDMPAQRRAAKGKERSALAKIEQFDQRERFARDQVTAEVRDAYSALQAAYERAKVLREELEITEQLETAERVRFELGEGTLFLVNLREQATFDTALREVAAANEYFRAQALYDFAVAEALRRK